MGTQVVILICPDMYIVYSPGSIYSPWRYLTEGLGVGGEVAEGCGELVAALVN